MGRRGPPPTPTRILTMRNSWRAKVRPSEPKPKRGVPKCPAWLSPEAKAKWNEVTGLMDAAGMLTLLDAQALVRYCDAWGRWVAAAKFLSERGEMYPIKDTHGTVKFFQPWPQVAQYNKLGHMLLRLEQELGLSPSSRTRVAAIPDEDVDPLAAAKRAFFADRGAFPPPSPSDDGDADGPPVDAVPAQPAPRPRRRKAAGGGA